MSIIDEIIGHKKEQSKNNDINEMISKTKFKNNFSDLESNYGNFKITVIGIGGAGCNVIGQMKSTHKWANNVTFYAMNTDVGSLKRIWTYTDVWLLGKEKFRGGGSGGDPIVGETAANDDKESIKKILEGTDLLFLIAGLGKGTGSGAMPVVTKIAKEMNICTVCLMHLPSVQAEGQQIYVNALEHFKKTIAICDSYCTISNDRIINNNGDQLSLLASYTRSNEEIANIVSVVTKIINEPTNINIDFADVHNFFKKNHSFMVSTVILNSKQYTKQELFQNILNEINNSYCNLSIDKTSNILANIDICEDTSSNIVSDIREVFIDLSKNKDLWIVNGINYHKDDDKITLNFLISSNGTYNNDLNIKTQSDIFNKDANKYIESQDGLLNNARFNEIKNEIDEDEELSKGFDSESFICDDDEEIANIHNTRRLDSNQCQQILTEALNDISDIEKQDNCSN